MFGNSKMLKCEIFIQAILKNIYKHYIQNFKLPNYAIFKQSYLKTHILN